MPRLQTIDGFRGFFLLFMGIVHFNGVTDVILGKLNHHRFGWVQDAQGFVFISGLVVGLVYGKKHLRNSSISAIYVQILKRVGTIYSHQIALIVIMLAAALLLGSAAATNLGAYQREPVAFTLSSSLLLTASTHMGILPMYIFYLLAVPFALHALGRGYVAPFVLAILLSWLFGQTGMVEFGMESLAGWLRPRGLDLNFGIGFEAFSWQLFFFGGLFFGFRMAEGRLDLDWLGQEQYRVVFKMSLVAIFLLGLLYRTVNWEMLGDEFSAAFNARSDRGLLTSIYPIAFLIDLFVVVWMLRIGVSDRDRWIRTASTLLAWLFSRRFLVVLGQHSLHVFSWHILVFYLLATLVPKFDLSEFGRTLVLIAAVASLYLAAYGHAWLRSWEREARMKTSPVAGE
ncbi:OpgC domain-containing protein [uncultured Amaricoccus sp.]|uniref:OpgC domain-containing protein n=1 Tax=uncultured Amaricoccus sp. TaxID=339341 RepID=UPI0026116656|nr:OpgC domain-containing protein [uncultured Amaricoccus sp.]